MIPEEALILHLLDKGFKSAILNMFKKLKEIMFEDQKESMKTMSYQIENIKKEVNYKKKPHRIPEVGKYNDRNEKFTRAAQADLSRQTKRIYEIEDK